MTSMYTAFTVDVAAPEPTVAVNTYAWPYSSAACTSEAFTPSTYRDVATTVAGPHVAMIVPPATAPRYSFNVSVTPDVPIVISMLQSRSTTSPAVKLNAPTVQIAVSALVAGLPRIVLERERVV
jgi:hypothetical protein